VYVIPALNMAGSSVIDNYNGDPLFVSADDLRVQAGSPARNHGMNGNSEGWTNFPSDGGFLIDIRFMPRPASGNWTIGAYE
jgi:hypothetical protein